MSRPEIKRQRIYFTFPSAEGVEDKERYWSITGNFFIQLFLDPFFYAQRKLFSSIFSDMYHHPENAIATGEYTPSDVLLAVAVLQGLLTQLGIITGQEAQYLKENDRNRLDTQLHPEKFMSWEQLIEFTAATHQAGKTIGLVHGSFDQPHPGHAQLFAETWPYCDVLLVGLDSDKLIRARKGSNRPRIPLGARIWQIVSLPTVDKVFVLPPQESDPQAFENIYRQLHITVLGCGADNPLIPEYRARMESLGGQLITSRAVGLSSTLIVEQLNDPQIQRKLSLTFDIMRAVAQPYDEAAREYWNLDNY